MKKKKKGTTIRQESAQDSNRNTTTDNHSHEILDARLESLHAVRPYIIKFFGRVARLSEKVDQAFAGQPFWPNLPPDAPANRRRFRAYTELHEEGVKLFSRALEVWMLSYGFVFHRGPHSRGRNDTKNSRRGRSKKS
jgi:hypothetical protein